MDGEQVPLAECDRAPIFNARLDSEGMPEVAAETLGNAEPMLPPLAGERGRRARERTALALERITTTTSLAVRPSRSTAYPVRDEY